MNFKKTVVTDGVQPPIWFAMGVLDSLYQTIGVDMVVTALTDSHKDRPASLHNKGLAVDVRTKTLSLAQAQGVFARAVKLLNPMGFDVVLETSPPHLHVEYDPKAGETLYTLE